MRFVLLLFFSFGYSQISLVSQSTELFEKMEVSLLTCKNGDELYSTFGHTAIRLYNPLTEADIVYNYGTFDFKTPYFYPKFLRGKLPYKLAAARMSNFLREYQYEQRSVLEQKLLLTTEQKEAIFHKLATNIKPENRFYKYDFFFDNCTTRTMDLIEDVVGKLHFENEVKDITFRNMLKENLHSLPWSEFGIDLIIGAVADQKTSRREQYFLPIYLHDALNEAELANGSPITTADKIILDFEAQDQERKQPSPNWPLYISILLLLVELALWKAPSSKIKHVYDKVWMWLMGIMGLVMAFMWFATDHLATKQNYNLLWANPIFLIYLKIGISHTKKWLGILLLLLAGLTMVNTVWQILPQYFHPAFGVFALISAIKIWTARKYSLITTTK